MRLEERLWSYTADHLKRLVRVLGGPGPEGTRKEFLVRYVVERLTRPDSLEELWKCLDPLSQKAVAAAFHNGGEFNEEAFIAQYRARPRRRGHGYWYSYDREVLPLDLFIYESELPRELIPLLEPLVPPPERFQLEGLAEAPGSLSIDGEQFPLRRAETERAGMHDLQAYLRLYRHGSITHSTSSSRLTTKSIRTLLDNLLEGDFLPHEGGAKLKDTIRPSGLDVFVRGSGLARGYGKLSDTGEALLRDQDPEALLDAFETWAGGGNFDELSRISAIKGQGARRTRLTPPASRREAIIEALSWSPVGVWIAVSDFYRALKIWHFDFELDESNYSGLYIGDSTYGRLEDAGAKGWAVAKALYVNAVLWEYLGSIGALDLLYLLPEDAHLDHEHYGDYEEYYSLYDGLAYFRINLLGAYLLGQAGEYIPSYPTDAALFSIDPAFILTLEDPKTLTPNLRHQLEQLAVEQDREHYRLDTQQVLNALESGGDFRDIADFIAGRNTGPLPKEVTDWLEEIQGNLRGFRKTGNAVLVNARNQALLHLAEEDPIIRKFANTLGLNTLVIPANREKAFRERLKELGYLLSR